MKNVSVIGMGYIGLPTAAVLAASGMSVLGVDVDPLTVATINAGKIHIVEPGLEALVSEVVSSGKLKAVAKPEAADVFIIAVPTPFNSDQTANISYIEAAAKSIAPVLEKGNLVILESTSPVGTTELLCANLSAQRPDIVFPCGSGEAEVFIAYCPERVLPGKIISELRENDRIVGGMTEACTDKASLLYGSFVSGRCLRANARTAEMAKLTENAYRDVNIAFANELSMITDQLDINVWELISLANCHPRVDILNPGPGVGGHCIAVDPWFIVQSAPDVSRLIKTARLVNDAKPEFVLGKILEAVSEISNPVVTCLGLAFKANIDDLRESPALAITEKLAKGLDASVLVVEPHIDVLPETLVHLDNTSLVEFDEGLKKADIVVLLVDHDTFLVSGIDEQLLGKVVIDTRGAWS